MGRENTTQILAFDPGETTGVAKVTISDEECHIAQTSVFRPLELFEFLNPLPQVDTVVIEKFVLYAHKSKVKAWSDFPEIRIQGAIEFASWRAKVEVVLQTASTAKQAVPDDVLRRFALVWPKTAHERDAARHAIRYCLVSGLITKLPPY